MDIAAKSLEVIHIEEPALSFGHGQTCDHPKDGLFLYGPHSGPARSRDVSVGVIGTKEGLGYFRNWAITLGGFVAVPPRKKTDKENRLHLSNFPGLEEAFGIMVSPGEFVERTVDAQALDDATRTVNKHEAVSRVVRQPEAMGISHVHSRLSRKDFAAAFRVTRFIHPSHDGLLRRPDCKAGMVCAGRAGESQ